jgi:hypothetical protein
LALVGPLGTALLLAATCAALFLLPFSLVQEK